MNSLCPDFIKEKNQFFYYKIFPIANAWLNKGNQLLFISINTKNNESLKEAWDTLDKLWENLFTEDYQKLFPHGIVNPRIRYGHISNRWAVSLHILQFLKKENTFDFHRMKDTVNNAMQIVQPSTEKLFGLDVRRISKKVTPENLFLSIMTQLDNIRNFQRIFESNKLKELYQAQEDRVLTKVWGDIPILPESYICEDCSCDCYGKKPSTETAS